MTIGQIATPARVALWAAALVLYGTTAATAESGLKPGPGRDLVEVACSICHTTGYIQMNSPFLTPDVWKAEVAKMRTVFGAPVDDDVAASVLAYLNQAYGVPAKP